MKTQFYLSFIRSCFYFVYFQEEYTVFQQWTHFHRSFSTRFRFVFKRFDASNRRSFFTGLFSQNADGETSFIAEILSVFFFFVVQFQFQFVEQGFAFAGDFHRYRQLHFCSWSTNDSTLRTIFNFWSTFLIEFFLFELDFKIFSRMIVQTGVELGVYRNNESTKIFFFTRISFSSSIDLISLLFVLPRTSIVVSCRNKNQSAGPNSLYRLINKVWLFLVVLLSSANFKHTLYGSQLHENPQWIIVANRYIRTSFSFDKTLDVEK